MTNPGRAPPSDVSESGVEVCSGTPSPMESATRYVPSATLSRTDLAKEMEAMLAQLDVEADRRSMQIVSSSSSSTSGSFFDAADMGARGALSGWLQGLSSNQDDLNSYSILLSIPIEKKSSFVERAVSDPFYNKIIGSMVGMGVGDALGHPFEFMPAQDSYGPHDPHFDLKSFRFVDSSNSFRLQRGQWTDDAAMGLCMADSLIMRGQFDGSDMRVRFWCWWNRGYNNAFRKDKSRRSSVGLGGNISKSLHAVGKARHVGNVPPVYEAVSEDAGNGSLMRFAPIALMYHSADLEEVYDIARKSSYTTHPGIIAAEACSLLAHLIVRALQLPEGPVDVKDFLEQTTTEYYHRSGLSKKSGWGYDQMKELVLGQPALATERCWAWREETLNIKSTLKARGSRYNGYPVSAGYFGSYSLDGLAMALWSVYHTTSFDEAVARSVNLLGDADSHGSITGQLAGAIYGYRSIHPKFIEWLNIWDDSDFAVKGAMLAHLGARNGSGSPKRARTGDASPL